MKYTEAEVFIMSDQALTDIVDQVTDEQWGMKLPEWFPLGGNQDRDKLTLKDIINYHAFDEAWVPDVLAGKTKEEVGTKYDGDLLGADPKASWHTLVDKATEAVKTLDDPDKPAHLSYGDFPAKEYLKHITSFRGLRAFDFARLLGLSTDLSADLIQGMYDEFAPEAAGWRQMGVFGPEVMVPADASIKDRLLGLVGKDPKDY